MNHILAPTITVLPDGVAERVVVTASHGGLYPGYLVLAARARAAIFNDAGIGMDRAGIAALDLLQGHGKAAAAVSHSSARIGDADASNQAQITTLKIAQLQMISVDPYEATTLLQQAQTQLEQLYTITARMARLHLTDYLR